MDVSLNTLLLALIAFLLGTIGVSLRWVLLQIRQDLKGMRDEFIAHQDDDRKTHLDFMDRIAKLEGSKE